MSKKIVDTLAKALHLAFLEHGRPNTFSPGELAAEYCNISAMTIGRFASVALNMIDLDRVLREQYGWSGSGVRYDRRKFAA